MASLTAVQETLALASLSKVPVTEVEVTVTLPGAVGRLAKAGPGMANNKEGIRIWARRLKVKDDLLMRYLRD